jgi:hypothetical protein
MLMPTRNLTTQLSVFIYNKKIASPENGSRAVHNCRLFTILWRIAWNVVFLNMRKS